LWFTIFDLKPVGVEWEIGLVPFASYSPIQPQKIYKASLIISATSNGTL